MLARICTMITGEIQNGLKAAWETVWPFLMKLNMYPVKHDTSLSIYPREMNIYVHQKLYTNVYSSLIHNSQTGSNSIQWVSR